MSLSPPSAARQVLGPPRPVHSSGLVAHLARVRALQAERLLLWGLRPDEFPTPVRSPGRFPRLQYTKVVPVVPPKGDEPGSLEAGERAHLASAAACLEGLTLRPGRPLSFWRALEPLTRAGGFHDDVAHRASCRVPALGGGVHMLASGLFELAVWLGWRIHERHGLAPESVPGALTELWGLEAAVLWPYLDLRVAPVCGEVRLSVHASSESLTLEVHGRRPRGDRVELSSHGETLLAGSKGPLRRNSVVRRVRSLLSDRVLDERVVAYNLRRSPEGEAAQPGCLLCAEASCLCPPTSAVPAADG